MKSRSKLFVSIVLILCMLCSLSVSVFAADSHRYDYQNPNAVYPTEPYSYETYRSPDGGHILRVRINEINHVTYYDAFALIDVDDGTILREFDIHAIYNDIEGLPMYGVNWSTDGRFVVIDYPHTQVNGVTTLILDTEELDFWMPPSALDNYNYMMTQNKTLPEKDMDGMRPWMVECWNSDECVSLITEYVIGEQRIWARMVFDAVNCKVVSRKWGNSADLDDPKNPIWTKAAAVGVPAYNTEDFSVISPDGTHTVIVHAADKVSDANTWNALYEGITLPCSVSDTVDEITLPLTDTKTEPTLWHDISVMWSPDGRYVAYQSEDDDSLARVYDLVTGGMKNLNIHYGHKDTTKVRIIAFSVFDEILYEIVSTAPTGEETREIRIKQMNPEIWGHPSLYVSAENGFAAAEAVLPAAVPTVKDGFTGFIGVSKTHTTGLDGLFRIGEDYYYLRMVTEKNEDGSSAYREYVCRADVRSFVFDEIPMKYVHTTGGCFILGKNDRTLYAGTGVVGTCGRSLIAINLEPIDDMYAIITDCTLYDANFRTLVSHVIDTAVQEDGSVYVMHVVGKGEFLYSRLSYIAADGSVTSIGAYNGDLSEYRK